jgi:hypothetical protein
VVVLCIVKRERRERGHVGADHCGHGHVMHVSVRHPSIHMSFRPSDSAYIRLDARSCPIYGGSSNISLFGLEAFFRGLCNINSFM